MVSTVPVVLVEGDSDAAVVGVFAAALGLGPHALETVDLHGITNFRAAWTSLAGSRRVLGLCDVGERHHVLRTLQGAGIRISGEDALEDEGFFTCVRDLEDELLRALGGDQALDVVVSLGLGTTFTRFSRQPAWHDRPLGARLRRFAGSGSGRKLRLGTAWARAIPPETMPPPLRRLLAAVAG